MGAGTNQRLVHLEIRDFRGIDHLALDFPEGDDGEGGMLVLAGDNGVGKTSVLEAILVVMERFDLLPGDTASPVDLARQGAMHFELEGSAKRGGRVRTFRINGGLIAANARNSRMHSTAAASSGSIGSPPTDWILAFNRNQLRDVRREPNVEYFSARREPVNLGGQALAAPSRESTREEARLAELKRRLVNVFARSGRNAIFGRIEAFMRPFLGDAWTLDVIFRGNEPGSDGVVVVRDGPLPKGHDGDAPTLETLRERAARGGATPRVIPIDRLSSGQMALLAMAYPFVFGDRPVDIALIDEPEQHMHVTWQRSLLGSLRRLSPTTQFVVATHSSEILDSVATYQRRMLVSDDDPRGSAPLAAAE